MKASYLQYVKYYLDNNFIFSDNQIYSRFVGYDKYVIIFKAEESNYYIYDADGYIHITSNENKYNYDNINTFRQTKVNSVIIKMSKFLRLIRYKIDEIINTRYNSDISNIKQLQMEIYSTDIDYILYSTYNRQGREIDIINDFNNSSWKNS